MLSIKRVKIRKCFTHSLALASLAFLIVINCCAITESTSMSIRLNSSKQHQAPDVASPEKNLPIICGCPAGAPPIENGHFYFASRMKYCS
ncbi:hypothetical protein KM043_010781 [Ampulex compressa]|nr:hypothetical protein KM043_010781 [Ampulex compressa]